ncbi:MAG TPA: asparagine synthase (glutamine-hydrolyzing) [Planctomycetota bacterium]|nr:asparagine synthase (glutamine-hydrolyzing) [Planctomycetota bacterium]
MCGIAGFWGVPAATHDLERAVGRMAARVRHRGPDDQGSWSDPATGVALGFRRLAILDPSAEGHQPMRSESGRYVIVFNGEVYNFRSIRSALDASHAVRWRGGADTEVVLAAIEHWGLERALAEFMGMFAFALWDSIDRCLSLVRDRFGIKPLYYGWTARSLLFGSELAPFHAHPEFEAEIDRASLASFMRRGGVPAPRSIFKDVYKLPPGAVLSIRSADERAEPRLWWDSVEMEARAAADPFRGTPDEAVEALEVTLREAVGLHMVSDVPLGAFLSGGIDSSTVVSLMQTRGTGATKTFTIGFEDARYNEAPYARAVAWHLGTEHTELCVSSTDALASIADLPKCFDEPFADSSQIPMMILSRLARRDVTVALSGDGGDELFAGYPRYVFHRDLWRRLHPFPEWTRTAIARALTSVSPSAWDRALAPLRRIAPSALSGRTGDKIHKMAELMRAPDAEGLFETLMTSWHGATPVLHATRTGPRLPPLDRLDRIERMMVHDLLHYLPDDILTKVDRASMACGLEARVPLLDHRVVQLAWRLPLDLKLRGGDAKWILKRVLERYVPRRLFERPKAGFAVPVGDWLRGPLRVWAEGLLDRRALEHEGLLDADLVAARWADHVSGRCNWQNDLWNVLMFQAWLRECQTSRAQASLA